MNTIAPRDTAPEWPERLTLRDTKVIADEGQRIFSTATGYGYAKHEYVRADLVPAPTSSGAGAGVTVSDDGTDLDVAGQSYEPRLNRLRLRLGAACEDRTREGDEEAVSWLSDGIEAIDSVFRRISFLRRLLGHARAEAALALALARSPGSAGAKSVPPLHRRKNESRLDAARRREILLAGWEDDRETLKDLGSGESATFWTGRLAADPSTVHPYTFPNRESVFHEGAKRFRQQMQALTPSLAQTAPDAGPAVPQPISSAPKDRPILAWCDHEADPYSAGPNRLTLYAGHAEGMGHAPTGWHIVEWGGAFDDSTWEYPNQASLPDWWFVAGSEFEVAANPVIWIELPASPLPAGPSETDGGRT